MLDRRFLVFQQMQNVVPQHGIEELIGGAYILDGRLIESNVFDLIDLRLSLCDFDHLR